jgi:hypothetical protein
MLNLSLPGRVFLCTLPTDMRKSFDSLVGLVEQQLGQDGWHRSPRRFTPRFCRIPCLV